MLKKFNLSDFVVFIFLVLSGIIILFGKDKTEHFSLLIGSRIAAFAIIFAIIKRYTNNNSKIVSFLKHLYPLLFTAYFYGETGYYNNIFLQDLDGLFVQMEDLIFGFQASLWFSLQYNSIWFNELMYFSYFSFYLIIIAFPIILYFKKKSEFEKFFFIIIFSSYSYYLFFVLFPVVGPQFYFPMVQVETSQPLIWEKIIKFIQHIGETPTGAFPSSHVGLSWIILLISAKIYKQLFLLILPLAVLICFSTVYIKAHYVIDIIGGLITVPLLYFLGDKIYTIYHKKLQYTKIN